MNPEDAAKIAWARTLVAAALVIWLSYVWALTLDSHTDIERIRAGQHCEAPR